MGFEADIITFLQGGATPVWTSFFETVSLLGSWVGLIIAFLFLFIFSRRYAVFMACTYGFGVGINYILKTLISRDRPYVAYDSIKALSDAIGNSMPSGHSVSVIILAIFVSYFVCKVAKNRFTKIATIISFALFVFMVVLSRMYLGLHYLTDTIAGLALGALIATIGICIFRKLSKIKIRGER